MFKLIRMVKKGDKQYEYSVVYDPNLVEDWRPAPAPEWKEKSRPTDRTDQRPGDPEPVPEPEQRDG